MVAPSCCLEYRPTATFWVILLFIVFPIIYLAGKVVGTVITVLFRVLRGLYKLVLWDDVDFEEEEEELRLERQARLLEKEQVRMERRQERALKRHQAAALESIKKSEQMTSLMANGAPRNGIAKRVQPVNGVSESLNSECEVDDQRIEAPVVVEAVEAVATTVETTTTTTTTVTLGNGHATLPDVPTPLETPILTNGHVTVPIAPVTGETGTTTMITTQLWHRKSRNQ